MSAVQKWQPFESAPPARDAETSLPSGAQPAGWWDEEPATSVNLARLIAAFRRRLRLFGVVAASVLAATVSATLLMRPTYTATAQVMLEPRVQKVTNDDLVPPLPADSPIVDTEVEVLKSPQLAERVVDELRLDKDPEFNRAGSASTNPQIARRKVIDAVSKHLSVERDQQTYVIKIRVRSAEPAKASRIANTFARLYIAEQVEAKAGATHQAAAWLSARLKSLRAQVLADEGAVQQFKIANNLMSASGATLTEQEISSYNQALAQAQTQVAEDEARLSTARAQLSGGSTGDDVGETLNSPTIQKLKERREEASQKVASLSTEFRDDYPPLKVAHSELADIDAQIRAETRRIISNLTAKLEVSRQRTSAIQGTLSGAKGQLTANNRDAVALAELQRNADASRELYGAYLARYKETSAQEGLQKPDSRMVSPASPPTSPSSPNVPLNLALGLFLALGAGTGAVVLAELLETGVFSSADVEKRFRIRYLGAIPLLGSVANGAQLSPVDYVIANPLSGFAEAFRSLRSAIVHGSEGPIKVVVVTSALPGEGKTTTAVCLGRLAALQGAKVVIVDCDLRRRSMQGALDTNPRGGLLEVLEGETSLEEAIVHDADTGADILPIASERITPKDVFGGAEFDRLRAKLTSAYDLVLLDTPPVLAVSDSRVLARKADFVLFVARWKKTPTPAIHGALRLLAASNVGVSGIILNQFDMNANAVAYGDPSAYFSSYKQYYLESSK